MMNPVLLGIAAAFAWGTADFVARFTSRGIGSASSLFGMLAVGSVALTAWMFAAGEPLVWQWPGAWLLLATGVLVMVPTLFLYNALARGPVSVVAPVVGAYPALVLLIAVALGARPGWLQWIAMAVVMAGVAVVGRAAKAEDAEGEPEPPGGIRRTLLYAGAAAFFFALSIVAGQAATPMFGEVQTVWASRIVGLLALLPLFLLPRYKLRFSASLVPALLLQGLLDAGAYLALFTAGHGDGGEIAAVIASGFGAVAALWARGFLKETITPAQWGGMALIFGGVAVLSGH
ncbi:MAG: DMT family transporter [Rhodospirillales bacterium]|nr:DMT family transporter [Rhodospirillales bacterium]